MINAPVATEKDIEELAATLGAAIARTVPPAKWHEFIGLVITEIEVGYVLNARLMPDHWNSFIKNLTQTVKETYEVTR